VGHCGGIVVKIFGDYRKSSGEKIGDFQRKNGDFPETQCEERFFLFFE
jgi:hypothetical protein